MLMTYLINALHSAAESNDLEAIRLLILNMVCLNQKNNEGWSALHLAVKNENIEIMKMLIEAKADMGMRISTNRHPFGYTPLELAASIGNMNIFIILLNLSENCYIYNLLEIATKCNQIEIVNFLITNGASFIKPSKRWNLLHTASNEGHFDLCVYFIDKGIDVDSESDFLFTPLHLAAEKGHFEIAKYLIKLGANVKAKTNILFTPLHLAAQFDNLDIAELLLKQGADINAPTNEYFTPLHLACKGFFTKMVTFLINEGADIHALTKWGWRPSTFGCSLLINSIMKNANAED